MSFSKTQKKFAAFFLIMTLMLSCGFGDTVYVEEDDGDSLLAAFVAGCITGLLLASHDDEVVYHEHVVVEEHYHYRSARPALPGVYPR